MPTVRRLAIPDIVEIVPERHGDDRGFFSEVWSAAALAAAGVEASFVQDNHSLSRDAGVLRGLHYQAPPRAQGKLVRVARGAIFDVAVDIRRGSPTFGRWVGLELSAAAWNQVWVPPGFAHGFLTLQPETEVLYKVTAPYSAQHERAIRFDDRTFAIPWPLKGLQLRLSDRDRDAPAFAEVGTAFRFGATG